MGAFAAYSIMVAVVMTILTFTYKWLMASTTLHAFNRATLLLIIGISWILPALLPLVSGTEAVEVATTMPIAVDVALAPKPADVTKSISWVNVAVWVYYIGMICTTLHTIIGAIGMARLIHKGEKRECGGYTMIVNAEAPGPFSWGRWIVVRPEDCDQYLPMIESHEIAHLKHYHWLDLALAQLNAIAQWFSPAAWLTLGEIKSVHEYQADAEASKGDMRTYQLMLLKKTAGSSFPTFADSLNHSQIKQRLTMMMKPKSNVRRGLASLALPGMAVAAMYAISSPIIADVVSDMNSFTVATDFNDKVSNSIVADQTEARQTKGSGVVTEVNDEILPQEEADTPEEIATDVIEPEGPLTTEASLFTPDDKQPEKPAIFVNGQPGSLDNITPDQIKEMKVVKNDPAYPEGKVMITLKSDNEKAPAAAVEHIAEFKGGQKALLDFIAQNIKWPAGGKLEKTGRVIVQFTVGTDGSMSNPEIKQGISPEFDAEAVRVVNLMSGHWIPASNGGTPIVSTFVIPITFKAE